MPGSLTVERAFPEIEELSDDAYWRSVERVVATCYRGKALLTDRHNEVGFRCVYPLEEG